MSEHVWTGFDVYVYVYYDDGDGNRINEAGAAYNPSVDQPVLEYCFFQDVEISVSQNMDRRPVTGRAKQRIVPQDMLYEARVRSFYFKKSAELNGGFLNREKFFQFEMKCYDPLRISTPIDQHVLSIAHVRDLSISSEENGIARASAVFWAEEFT